MHVRIVTTEEERARCYAIRFTVFVEEQKVPREEELDALEDECVHFLALPDAASPLSRALGTARLWVTPDGHAKAQRVAVLAEARGLGAGAALMRALEAEARRKGHDEVVLAAQVQAIPFYERLGYAAYGDLFEEAAIMHRWMRHHTAPR